MCVQVVARLKSKVLKNFFTLQCLLGLLRLKNFKKLWHCLCINKLQFFSDFCHAGLWYYDIFYRIIYLLCLFYMVKYILIIKMPQLKLDPWYVKAQLQNKVTYHHHVILGKSLGCHLDIIWWIKNLIKNQCKYDIINIWSFY